jgi:hypothetical protein
MALPAVPIKRWTRRGEEGPVGRPAFPGGWSELAMERPVHKTFLTFPGPPFAERQLCLSSRERRSPNGSFLLASYCPVSRRFYIPVPTKKKRPRQSRDVKTCLK